MNLAALEALREAVSLSPENAPLRQALAEMLLGLGRAAEAEKEYRLAVSLTPDDARLKLGLAKTFFQQGKASAALVIVEDLTQSNDAPAAAYLLYARLLHNAGDADRAARLYRQAIDLDPALADPQLDSQFGVARAAEYREQEYEADADEDRRLPQSWQELPDEPTQSIERPALNFADVGGLEPLKEEIRIKIIHPLNHAELYQAYGKATGGGILLYGPPGCGKTFMARATAGEIKAGFLAVGISDVLDMWIGNSEKNLHELFEQGRRNQPCVLFFDEVDALAASRSDMRTNSGRHLINQFLAEMDGIQASNEGLLILAATNAPWHVDAAFRRPGRFDRIMFVPPPDRPARAAILRAMLRGKPVADVDHDQIARKTDGFSGADLKAVVDTAIEAKLREAMRDGVPRPLTTKDLLSAASTLKPSTREWFATARNYALYSNQGGMYDDILKYLKI